MKTRPYLDNQSQSGYVMILTLILTMSLAVLALSSHSSVESKISVQRNESSALRASLAAQAGLEHAKKMLSKNYYWEGTEDWVAIGNSRFNVVSEMLNDDDMQMVHVRVVSEGSSGHGKHMLAMEYQIKDGDGLEDVGCYLLSSNIDLDKCHLNTDIFLADQPGATYDYRMDSEGNLIWTLNETDLGPTAIFNTSINHTSFQYSDDNYFKGNYDRTTMESPFYMPAWNLDSYLAPSNDRILLTGITEIQNINFNKTVVVRLNPGETFNVFNCNLLGGVVIYVEPDYDVRIGARNFVTLDKSVIGNAANPHVGLIAPASEIQGGGQNINIHGYCFWNSINDLDNVHLNGALIVVNEIFDMDNFNFQSHIATLRNPPEGIEMRESTSEFTVVGGGESLL
jgi:hypothetical protein